MNEEKRKEIYKKYGGITKRTKPFGNTNIPTITTQNLEYLFQGQTRQVLPHRRAIAVYYHDEGLFRSAINQVVANSKLSTLIWTDCIHLDHNREGMQVAAAFSITEPAFFVFDNFQTIPNDYDRKLTFLHWFDGEIEPQLAQGSLFLLGIRLGEPVPPVTRVMTPSVSSRCYLGYLASELEVKTWEALQQETD